MMALFNGDLAPSFIPCHRNASRGRTGLKALPPGPAFRHHLPVTCFAKLPRRYVEGHWGQALWRRIQVVSQPRPHCVHGRSGGGGWDTRAKMPPGGGYRNYRASARCSTHCNCDYDAGGAESQSPELGLVFGMEPVWQQRISTHGASGIGVAEEAWGGLVNY